MRFPKFGLSSVDFRHFKSILQTGESQVVTDFMNHDRTRRSIDNAWSKQGKMIQPEAIHNYNELWNISRFYCRHKLDFRASKYEGSRQLVDAQVPAGEIQASDFRPQFHPDLKSLEAKIEKAELYHYDVTITFILQ